jgi:hypothetical protein
VIQYNQKQQLISLTNNIMDLIEILNKTVPNAGPQARASITEAERRLTTLEGTDPKRAAILREQAASQISSRDNGIKFTLADIGKLHGSSLGRAEPQEKTANQDEVARSIEQLVSVADSRNIAIPPAVLNNAANAFVSKDQDAVSALANSIAGLVDAGIKVQMDEQKVQRQFNDGSISLVGSQSGTRYDNAGSPIPFGNKNAEQFSIFAEKAYSSIRQSLAGVPVIGDIVNTQAKGAPIISATQAEQINIDANPEAYASQQVPDLTSTQLKEQAIAEARNLYDQGDPVSAAQKLNAYGIQGSLGGAVSPNDLQDIFGERRLKQVIPSSTETTPSEKPNQSPPSKKPLGEIFK